MADFPKKYAKLLGDFPDKVDGMSEEELIKELTSCEETVAYQERDMEEDPDLKQAKDKVKTLKTPFDEVIKENTAKIKYIMWTANERGVSLRDSKLFLAKQTKKDSKKDKDESEE